MKSIHKYLHWFLVIILITVPTSGVSAQMLYPSQDEYRIHPWPQLQVQMEILVHGQPIRTISHQGKTYLPITHWGDEYLIRIRNNGPKRIVAIVSVDGLSILNGKPASVRQAGYVVAAHSSIVIRGWQKDWNNVATFRFEPREKSYASRMGHRDNIGVIGLIAVEEKTRWVPEPRPLMESRSNPGSYGVPAPIQNADVGGTGTGYGRNLFAPIEEVPFVRSNNQHRITIYFDTRRALQEAGVLSDTPRPQPFPGDFRFVPPPPQR